MTTIDPGYDQRSKFSRELPVKLNAHELEIYGKTLAEKVNEKKMLEEKKKQSNKEWATKIGTVNNEISRIASARANGEELRPVQCGERLHGNVIEIIRLDTHEVVDVRPAEMRDLQQELPEFDVSDVTEPVGAGESAAPPDDPKQDADDEDEPEQDDQAEGTGVVRDSDGQRVGEAVATSGGAVAYVSDENEDEDPLADHLVAENEREHAERMSASERRASGGLTATPAERQRAKRERSSKALAVRGKSKSVTKPKRK